MPISVTGSNRSALRAKSLLAQRKPSRDAGFSLVELLAVLAILSLMMGAVVMTLPKPASEADRITESVEAQLSRFLDDGAVYGEMRALGVDADAVALFRHDGLQWQEAGRLDWPDGARIVLRRGEDDIDLPELAEPSLLFEPYGAVPDFDLRVQAGTAEYRFSADSKGRIIRTVDP